MSTTPTLRRLTVVEQLNYQNGCNDPLSIAYSYDSKIEADEQAYVRYVTITTEPTSLDHGWVKQARMLHIHNQGNVDIQLGIMSVGEFVPIEIIRPKHTRRTEPFCLADLAYCVASEDPSKTCKLKISIIPF